MDLRPYQSKLIADVWGGWNNAARNVLMRLDTGGGKTVILAFLVNWWISQARGAVAVIAHRHELVAQLSLTLARFGIVHNIIASADTRRGIIAMHMLEFGRSYYAPGSLVGVASVDTLVRADLGAWFAQVTFWITDEGHHVVLDNKWHTAIQKFTHKDVHGLLPTATPGRADGKGLGRHADGVADLMVEGPPMRWLIENGYLTDYRIFCPESDLVMYEEAGASGDWSPQQLKEASKRSHIIGDVVKEYLRHARGKLGITFTTDIETAGSMAQAYRDAGVRAEMLTGKTDAGYRRQIIRRFAARELDQIVAVDIISEGFDLPAIEAVSMARPTQSLPLYMQQFGRGLRTMPGKTEAIIIDHVANTARHQGPPDKPRVWSLDRRAKRNTGGGIPIRTCGVGWKDEALRAFGAVDGQPCWGDYERFFNTCPYCDLPAPKPQPTSRATPAAVEGDIVELDAETLARLRGDVLKVDMPIDDYREEMRERGFRQDFYLTHGKRHVETQQAQAALRLRMEEFVRRGVARGRADREIHKEFFMTFGVDVLSARALGITDATTLAGRIETWLSTT